MKSPTVGFVSLADIQVPLIQQIFIDSNILILLLAQLALMQKRSSNDSCHNIRIGMILIGCVLTVVSTLRFPGVAWLSVIIFALVALDEVLGRWLFYRLRM